jgi:hypothetical protein
MNSGAIIPLLLMLPNGVWMLYYSVGNWLGSVGNSGNTGEPHLHVHAQRPGPASAPYAGDPLPILFGGRYPVRDDRFESL